MSRSFTIQHGRVIALAFLVAGAGLACGTTTAAPASGDRPATTAAPGAAVASTVGSVDGLIADARLAQRQHDWRAIRSYQAQLMERVGLPAVREARGSYQRALADLAAATVRGDSHARAQFRTELRRLCATTGLASAFESCDGSVITWGH